MLDVKFIWQSPMKAYLHYEEMIKIIIVIMPSVLDTSTFSCTQKKAIKLTGWVVVLDALLYSELMARDCMLDRNKKVPLVKN